MDLIQRRRQLIGMPRGVIDTSPVIIQYDVRLLPGGSIGQNDGSCITKMYDVKVDRDTDRRFIYKGAGYTTLNYKNSTYIDYWNSQLAETEKIAVLVTYGTTHMQFSLQTSMLDDCYMIQVSTGRIIFAGKNTIYYGRKKTKILI